MTHRLSFLCFCCCCLVVAVPAQSISRKDLCLKRSVIVSCATLNSTHSLAQSLAPMSVACCPPSASERRFGCRVRLSDDCGRLALVIARCHIKARVPLSVSLHQSVAQSYHACVSVCGLDWQSLPPRVLNRSASNDHRSTHPPRQISTARWPYRIYYADATAHAAWAGPSPQNCLNHAVLWRYSNATPRGIVRIHTVECRSRIYCLSELYMSCQLKFRLSCIHFSFKFVILPVYWWKT